MLRAGQMSLLLELLVFLIVEVLGDLLLEGGTRGAVRVLRSRTGRFVISGLGGALVGLAWGLYLKGAPTWPRLLWVSLAIAVFVALLAASRKGAPAFASAHGVRGWRGSLVPPWCWSSERLVALALLNAGLAAGIVLTFRPDPS